MFLSQGNLKGVSGSAVQLPARTFNRYGTGTVYSGVQFRADGLIYYLTSTGSWQTTGLSWLLDGAASSYYLVRSLGGPDSLNVADSGTLQQMNATLSYGLSVTGPWNNKTASTTFSIASDTMGSTIVAGPRVYTIYAEELGL